MSNQNNSCRLHISTWGRKARNSKNHGGMGGFNLQKSSRPQTDLAAKQVVGERGSHCSRWEGATQHKLGQPAFASALCEISKTWMLLVVVKWDIELQQRIKTDIHRQTEAKKRNHLELTLQRNCKWMNELEMNLWRSERAVQPPQKVQQPRREGIILRNLPN